MWCGDTLFFLEEQPAEQKSVEPPARRSRKTRRVIEERGRYGVAVRQPRYRCAADRDEQVTRRADCLCTGVNIA